MNNYYKGLCCLTITFFSILSHAAIAVQRYAPPTLQNEGAPHRRGQPSIQAQVPEDARAILLNQFAQAERAQNEPENVSFLRTKMLLGHPITPKQYTLVKQWNHYLLTGILPKYVTDQSSPDR